MKTVHSSRRACLTESSLVRLVLVWLWLSTACLIARPAHAAKCQDIPLRVTVYNNAITDPATGATMPSAIISDGGGEYTTATIQVCAGTYDAVTNVSGTKRTFTVTFSKPIPGSIVAAVPGWVPGTYAVSGWINVKHPLQQREQSDIRHDGRLHVHAIRRPDDVPPRF